MKALVLKAFGTLAVEERADPAVAEGEVLVRVVATGICGSDLHGFTGANGRRVPGQVMGHESVGRVAALGPGVHGLELEQLVTFNPVVIPEEDAERYAGREQHSPGRYVIGVRPDLDAAFAELVAVPARNIVVLPDGMPLLHGALIEPLAVAVHAVRRTGVAPGARALVVGGGPIGQSVVLALLMSGVERIVVSEMELARRALVERLGAIAIDPAAASVPDQVEAALGGPADVAVDAVGITRTINDALLSTAFGGTVCLVGMGSPRLDVDAFRVSTEERSLVGSFAYSAIDFADAAAWLATAPEIADELISREVPLAEANAAFVALAAGDGTPGKILVRLGA